MKTMDVFFIMLFVAWVFSGASAQTCRQEELTKMPGVWKAGLKGSTSGVSAVDLAKEKEIVAKVFNIIKEHYQPMGCEVSWSGVYGYNPAVAKDWAANPFGFGAYFLRYLCDKQKPGQHYVDVATPTSLYVNFNEFHWVKAAEIADDREEKFFRFRSLPENKEGYYFFKEDVDYNDKIKKYTWLFTYDNKLPYRNVTKKEYLLNMLDIFNTKIEEADKNYALVKTKNFPAEDMRYYTESHASTRAWFQKPIDEINNMLKTLSEEELSEPAIITSRGDGFPLSDFVEMGKQYSDILIKPDLSYYNTKLPLSAPQMFSIVLTISHGDPVFEHIYTTISKAIEENINEFKALLADQSQVTMRLEF
ncbi:hypothetical protein [Mariniradius sediminis]|uniref:Uncharacterized protein n=1 Tax=Mariniradius sediminis TaxID=2909237 RepID=A0ABS9BV11_9BACT|nr:hypothetical protein [Mariniradius sediminis]MCF1751174.1 hypothetical protein [Mariniradius sediminis]